MLNRIRTNEDIYPFLLVLSMILVLGMALGRAQLVQSINMQSIMLMTGGLAVLSGFALAKSRFPLSTAIIYGIIYGIFVLAWQVGDTYPDDMMWRERIADMVMRQVNWLEKAFTGGTSRDALIFVMHTTLIQWLLGITAAWWTFRRLRLWWVILPAGVVLLSVVYYASPWMSWYLAIYSLLVLLFIAFTHLRDNQIVWRRARVRYNHDISGNFLRSSLLAALLALVLVWRVPAMPANASVGDAINRVNEPWRQVRDNWQRLFSALSAQASTTSDPYRDTLTLGGPRNPGDAPIMDVYVEAPVRYAYWRSTVLDSYQNGIWRVADGNTITHYPDEPQVPIPDTKLREAVTQTFVNYIPNAGTIYAAPDIVNSDQQLLLKTDVDANGKNLVSAARSRYVLQLGDRYEATSLLSKADEASLRSASQNYSAQVSNQYLDVPDIITQRTHDLADRLAGRYDNPYDKAIAIQNYLRQAMTYNDQIDAPPTDAEAIDYFLFESQEGYCNYYASAFAMMLRTQGVPTRLSRGYASGEFNEDNNQYRVRARDAHTWPEVYFPDYGWIQFEPTVIITPPERPSGDGEEEQADDQLPFDEGLEEPLGEGPLQDLEDFQNEEPLEPELAGWQGFLGRAANGIQVTGTMLILVIATGLIFVADRMNRRVEGTIDGSYGRLEFWARWLGVPLAESQTPHERQLLFVETVPESEQPLRVLINEFVRKQFGPEKKENLLVSTLQAWSELRPIFIRRAVRNRFRRKSD
ncbi:MAG: transglutaminase-like domain-containing protein [Candidatus Promineifilaceae bacterium]